MQLETSENWYSNVILSEAKNLFVHFEKKN